MSRWKSDTLTFADNKGENWEQALRTRVLVFIYIYRVDIDIERLVSC